MAKLTLPPVPSGYMSTQALNARFEQIEDAIEDTVSRSGKLPNAMEADVDFGMNSLLNIDSFEAQRITMGGQAADLTAIQNIAGIGQAIVDLASIQFGPVALNTLTDLGSVSTELFEIIESLDTIDLVGTNIVNVNTVATNISNVNTVGGISGNVTIVGNNAADVNTVASVSSDVTTVAGQIAPVNNVSTVAGISGDVSTTAGISADITAVALNNANVTTVAASIGNVNTTAGSIANVNTVGVSIAGVNTTATNIANVNTVATNIANVNTVAGINAAVSNVSGISADVTAVNANSANVNTVATNIANVNTAATNIADVNTVAAELGVGQDVTVVAANIADVGTVSTNIADVNAVAGALALPLSAANAVSYDNAASGLAATNVQAAIDETNDVAAPAGAVMFFAMNTAPTGWLKANGAAISRTTYADLFAAIGTVFGAGDGSTTFNLPDLRGEFPRGWDDARGVDSGRAFGSAQLDQMQKITGIIRSVGFRNLGLNSSGVFSAQNTGEGTCPNSVAASYVQFDFDSAGSPNARVSSTTDGETRARNIALLACIKF